MGDHGAVNKVASSLIKGSEMCIINEHVINDLALKMCQVATVSIMDVEDKHYHALQECVNDLIFYDALYCLHDM